MTFLDHKQLTLSNVFFTDEPDHPGSKSEAEKKKDYVRVADDLKRMGDG